jgi:heterodisulfide reductase subunit C
METHQDTWTLFYENLDTLFEECNQCGKCSSGCPAARVLSLRPRKIALSAQRKKLEDLVTSDVIWLCAQCHQCVERCPRQVAPLEIIIYLQNLAVRKGLDYPRDLKIISNQLKRIAAIQGPQEVIDREFDEFSRESLGLPELKGPKDMDAFLRAFTKIQGEEC